MSIKPIHGLIVALAASLGVIVLQERGADITSPMPGAAGQDAISAADQRAPRDPSARGGQALGYPVVSAPEFRQWLYLEDSRFVTVHNVEVTDGVESSLNYEYSSSFDIDYLTARGADEYYLAGVDGDETVIERWSLLAHTGSRTTQWTVGVGGAVAPSPVGVPTIPGTPVVVTVGGSITAPSTRTRNPRLSRETLLRSATIAPVRCMLPDPEGRFLLVLGEDSSLSALDLLGSAGLQPLQTVAQMPELENIYSLDLFQHASYGRVLLATDFPLSEVRPFRTVIFFDSDNDGLFETHTVGDPVMLTQQYIQGADLLTW